MIPSNSVKYSEPSFVKSTSSLKPLAVSVKKARELLDIGNTTVWQMIKDGRVRTISIGRRRLVIYSSLENLIAVIDKPSHFVRTDKEPLVGPDSSDGS